MCLEMSYKCMYAIASPKALFTCIFSNNMHISMCIATACVLDVGVFCCHLCLPCSRRPYEYMWPFGGWALTPRGRIYVSQM